MYDAPCSLYTHPSNLAANALNAGHEPPPLEQARILEVGCALGGNLTPIAASLPHATFIGVDPFAEQIEQARMRAAQAGVGNVTYLPIGVEELEHVEGEFDYIICHGLLSWIPPEAQEATFELCARRLSPQGIAYISYNTYPRWLQNRYVRDVLRWRGRHLKPEESFEREARSALSLFARYASPVGAGAPRALFAEAEQNLKGRPDYYLAHEYLLDENHPYYFHEFIERIAQAGGEDSPGLCYLTEASSNTLYAHTSLSAALRRELPLMGEGQLAVAQHLDFLFNRSLRRSILIRADSPRAGGVRGCPAQAHPSSPSPYPALPSLEQLSKLYLTSPLIPLDPETLNISSPSLWVHRHTHAQRTVSHPLAQAVVLLASAAWPHPLHGPAWPQQALELAHALGAPHWQGEALTTVWREALEQLFYYEHISPLLLSPPSLAEHAPIPFESEPPRAAPHLTLSAPPQHLPTEVLWREITQLYHEPTLASPALSALLPHLTGERGWGELLSLVEGLSEQVPALLDEPAKSGARHAWGVERLSALTPRLRLAALMREAYELAILAPPLSSTL
jgi:SAM-dependent methyltransferase